MVVGSILESILMEMGTNMMGVGSILIEMGSILMEWGVS